MIFKLHEKNGITIARFIDVNRFTLAICEDVKDELKPLLNDKGAKMILDLEGISFIDSSGIGCVISLVKTAKSNGAFFKICNLSKEVSSVFELLHLHMILDIDKDVESSVSNFSKV